jgi:hypothetical protein
MIKVPLGNLANASLVGANTVKGPVPESAPVSFPAVNAATKVDKAGVAAASSTMFLPSKTGWHM